MPVGSQTGHGTLDSLRDVNAILRFFFYPNPGNAGYAKPTMTALLILCGLLVAGSFAIRAWRGRLTNPVSKKLSRSWSSATFWFGVTGIVMVVSRVEGIQFLAMRFLWVLWFAALLLYAVLQIRLFRTRFYEVLPQAEAVDPREKYLPKRKKH
ncbi:MAG: hypothetical protein Greene041619_1163 [Candidatus Peregrinibacteria bacterium Greene0416_19]|nr:MAG: hypothetical protein Greene041619_1163 [Candidatus Peregrinibacteria bacterium Greene0416_19]